ncbi:hypothetical protein [Sunxiuqinia indica]|uniref:hypothetical protein n=1 Tax=Sunxiuqinia indica TaxID=2692584 RepID=UPI001358B418|nr:hypothetical protein [Sunxiuqinia indica]
MKTQKFENKRFNEVRTLTLVDTVNSLYTHTFDVDFHDGDTDKVSINVNNNNNLGKWLQDNCDIEGTTENVELLTNLLK